MYNENILIIFQCVWTTLLKLPLTTKISALNLRIFSLACLALLFVYSILSKSSFIILIIFLLITVFSVSGSFANISYVDILGKSVLESKRKSLLFFIAAFSLLIASLAFWRLKEIKADGMKLYGIINFTKMIIKEIRNNKNLANYIIIINTLGISLTLLPFLISYAKEILYVGNDEIANSGVLLEVSSNHNRAFYTGLTGAGSIIPALFPIVGGWIIKQFGYAAFFILFITVIITSLYFVYHLNCKK